MKLRILSDLHREFGHVPLPAVEADVVVLAGDTDLGVRGVHWAVETFAPTPVLYLAGNHEYYGYAMEKLLPELRAAAAGTNVWFLENDVAEFGGYRFFGSTLWTDFRLFADQQVDAMLKAKDHGFGMTDYVRIRTLPKYQRLRPVQTLRRHSESLLAMKQFLAAGPRDRSVVITHHAPSARSLVAGWERDLLSAAYASPLDALLEEPGPALWVHGHIHSFRDYTVGRTRVLSNPLGYQGDEPQQTGFVPDLVIELPDGPSPDSTVRAPLPAPS